MAGREPTGAELAAQTADAQVLDNHRVIRDGSVWCCPRCRAAWPFPAPLPDAPGPCVPRRWGDGA